MMNSLAQPAWRPFSSLLRQLLLQLRPARIGFAQHVRRIGGKGVAVLLAAEQIKPFTRHQPETGVTGIGDATRNIDRVVAAELGSIDVRVRGKRRAVALIMETPDRPGFRRLEVRQAYGRAGVDEIRDRVIPLDGQTAEAIDHDALGGRGPGSKLRNARRAQPDPAGFYRQQGDQGYSGANADLGLTTVSFLPLCRH